MASRRMYLSGACGVQNDHSASRGWGLLWGACPQYCSCLLRVVCDGCLQDRPPLLLSDSLSLTLPGALLVLEALIGPELDCGGPDYWCQCVPGHMGPLELLVPSPSQLTTEEEEGGMLHCSLELHLSVLVTQSVNNMPTHTVHKWRTIKLPT